MNRKWLVCRPWAAHFCFRATPSVCIHNKALEIVMKSTLLAAALAVSATTAFASAEKYVLDPSHSQVIFSYDHLGFLDHLRHVLGL